MYYYVIVITILIVGSISSSNYVMKTIHVLLRKIKFIVGMYYYQNEMYYDLR